MFDGSDLFGDTPQPSNLTAEMAVLGALFHNNRMLDKCGPLDPRHFSDGILAEIFGVVREEIGLGRRVDAVALKHRFRSETLTTLLAAFVGHEVVPGYARLIVSLAKARELKKISLEMKEGVDAGDDPAKLALSAISQIDRVVQGIAVDSAVSLDTALDGVFDALNNPQPLAGISTGFQCIDHRLGGLEPGLVYVIAGRPGMGKSALAHKMCLNAARKGVGVLELSLEMSASQLARRALSIASGVPMMAIKMGQLSNADGERLVLAREELRGLPLVIDDAGGQTPAMIAAKARDARRRNGGLGLLMIDHLNLMKPEDADAKHGGTWAIGRASNAVLAIAKACNIPVILCVQLNRGVEAREDKRPGLSDLRQSGDIEQDAYAVGFVYRQEYYLKGAPEQKEGEHASKFEERCAAWHDARQRSAGMAEIIWGKVRDGETGVDSLRFHAPTADFSDQPS